MPSWELRQAQGYYGLKIEDSIKPEKYLHFRKPSEQHFQKFISSIFNHLVKDNYLVHNDFLENIKGDLPVGCWSIQPNYSKTIVFFIFNRLLWGVYFGLAMLLTIEQTLVFMEEHILELESKI
jgi:hypothetical protein